LETYQKDINILIEQYKSHGYKKFKFTDLVNIGKLTVGTIMDKGGLVLNGLLGANRRYKIPNKTSRLSYPALFNYNFNE